MLRILIAAGLFPITLLAVSLLPPEAAAQESAFDIIKRSDELMRGKTLQGTYRMTIVRPDWERTMRFHFWSEGTEKSFILIDEPIKDRGVTFLRIDRELWNYIPRINRVVKFPPSMMLQSWMGSDFSNDDLVKESSIVKDYTHSILGTERLDGQESYKIALDPKPQAAVTWNRIVYLVRVADYVPLKAEYFNERGERIRVMTFSEIKEIGARTFPARMELTEDKHPGRKTVLVLEDVVFDRPIRSSVFTQMNLRRAG